MDTPEVVEAIATLEEHLPTWEAPVMRGPTSGKTPIRTLISCIISLRTKDEVTIDASARLFERAGDVSELAAMDPEEVARLIHPAGFSQRKSRQIVDIARRVKEEFHGRVPDDLETLLTFKGVGRKTANLVITQAYGKPGICVDTHVHRIFNRWGYVETKSPDKTEAALRTKLPREFWLRINKLLVAFGQVLCKPVSPFCSRCPVAQTCPKKGVERSR